MQGTCKARGEKERKELYCKHPHMSLAVSLALYAHYSVTYSLAVVVPFMVENIVIKGVTEFGFGQFTVSGLQYSL